MKSDDRAERQSTIGLRVAERMRQLRIQESLTLAELGKQCRLSPAYLSRVENHQAALTLDNLELVAHALHVPLSAFLEEGEETPLLAICRAGKGRMQKIPKRKSLSIELIASEKRGKLMEPLLITLVPETARRELRSHPGEEFNHVMEGRCLFSYGQKEFSLGKGDSVYYDATVPHAMHASSGQRCVLFAVVASRDYLFHGDLSKLLKLDCKNA